MSRMAIAIGGDIGGFALHRADPLAMPNDRLAEGVVRADHRVIQVSPGAGAVERHGQRQGVRRSVLSSEMPRRVEPSRRLHENGAAEKAFLLLFVVIVILLKVSRTRAAGRASREAREQALSGRFTVEIATDGSASPAGRHCLLPCLSMEIRSKG